MRLGKRDILLFQLLNKFRILNIELIQMYCDYKNYAYCARRLLQLYDNKYIDKYRKDVYTPYVYFLKEKGMKEVINTNKMKYRRSSIINKNHIVHELYVAKVCYEILKQNNNLSVFDILTERDLWIEKKIKKNTKRNHLADITIPLYDFVVEIELNRKRELDLINNIFANNNYYQLWIVPENRKKIKETIEKQSIENTFIEVETINNIKNIDFNLERKKELLIESNPELMYHKQRAKELKKQMELDL